MTRREAVVYLGYVLVFAAVVVWAHLRYAPQRDSVQSPGAQPGRVTVTEPIRDKMPEMHRLAASAVR